MNANRSAAFLSFVLWILSLAWGVSLAGATEADELARAIASQPSVRPGLWTQFGMRDGALTAALSLGGKNTVHGLSGDPERVERVRKSLTRKGLYGPVSVATCDWRRLPYSPNIVNLLVVEDYPPLANAGLEPAEVMRVLCPQGVALLGGADAGAMRVAAGPDNVIECKAVTIGGRHWVKLVKATDPRTGEWEQYLCDAQRSGAARDAVAGPARGLRWLSGEPWLNYRDGCTMIAANGRCFYRLLSGERGTGGRIVARDAYNGSLLWEKEVEQLPQVSAFLAVGDRLYAEVNRHVMAFDAATGEEILDFKEGAAALTYCDGVLVFGPRSGVWGRSKHSAYDAKTAEMLWQDKTVARGPTVAVNGRLYFLNHTETLQPARAVICLDLKTGEKIWERSVTGSALCWGEDTLFVTEGVRPRLKPPVKITVHALDAQDGRHLWDREFADTKTIYQGCFFAGGLVWAVPDRNSLVGLDPRTGDVRKDYAFEPTMRGRCSWAGATRGYFLHKNMSAIDLDTGSYHDFFAGRGHCGARVIPAHGLLYMMPDNCACYPKINGFAGYTSVSASSGVTTEESRLVKGPAFGRRAGTTEPSEKTWPAFRADAMRSGTNAAELNDDLGEKWQADFDEAVTSPVVAGRLVFAALPSSHRVVALDAGTGEKRWQFATDARVDSPPTIHNGRVIFGSRDGHVYALSAQDGRLEWKFCAAPAESLIPVNGQLESVWPVHGSVLVHDSTLYFCAGRHTDADGGLYLYALDPGTGSIKWEKQVTRDILHAGPKQYSVPKVINDVLSTDGELLYLSTAQFDLETGEPVEKPAGPRVFCYPFGFLHDAVEGLFVEKGHHQVLHSMHAVKRIWFYTERTTFFYGLSFRSAGQNLSVSDGAVYGIFRYIGHQRDGESHMTRHYGFSDRLVGVDGTERKWQTDFDFRTAALVKAGEHVAVSGYDDAADRGVVQVLSADTGQQVATVTFGGHPIHCGLVPAGRSLYVSLREGRVICLE